MNFTAKPIEVSDAVISAMFEFLREDHKFSKVIICTGSMEPEIPVGTTVLVEHAPESIQVGDVIVFKNGDHLTAHQVTHVPDDPRRGTLLTRGDRTPESTEVVQPCMVMGKVVEIQKPAAGQECP